LHLSSTLNKHASKLSERPKVGIIMFAYALAHSPSTFYLAQVLAERGYSVEILINKQGYMEVTFPNPEIRVLSMGTPVFQPSVKNIDSPSSSDNSKERRNQRSSSFLIPLWMQLLGRFAFWLLPIWIRRNYSFVIGIESEGVFVASLLNLFKPYPLIYYSMELRLSGENDEDVETSWRVPKRLERWAHQRSQFTLIQDQERAAILSRENKVDLSKFLIVPAGMKGPQVTSPSSYLYKKLKIPEYCKIVLYAGNIAPWSLIYDVARTVHKWPQPWVLVVHGFVSDPEYASQITGFGSNGRVFLSTELLSNEAMDNMVRSAHVGLALYKAVGTNFRLTASASSKTAQYLKCRLPVIVSGFESTRKVIEAYGCGICVENPSEVPQAVHQLENDYETYARNTEMCYLDCFQIDPWLNKALDDVEARITHPI